MSIHDLNKNGSSINLKFRLAQSMVSSFTFSLPEVTQQKQFVNLVLKIAEYHMGRLVKW